MKSPASPAHPPGPVSGGVAQYFVEHAEVGWVALAAVLLWGWISFAHLGQQEDPKIPERRALLVTRFPGANTLKIEQLVTRKLEKKIAELQALEEISSQSRNGVSIVQITLRSASQAVVEQEWDKLRAKVNEVVLPEGCQPPFLDTDFGNTVTLLLAITSPDISDAECLARAGLIRRSRAALRAGLKDANKDTNRVTVVATFPASVARDYRATLTEKFIQSLTHSGLGSDARVAEGDTFTMADFASQATPEAFQRFLEAFNRQMTGTDGEMHPDFHTPLVLFGEEDPYPRIRSSDWPRYSYRELEQAAETVEDEVKQIGSVGRVRAIGAVNEVAYLLFSIATVTGHKINPDDIIRAIAARNAIIPGGNLRTEGQNFPVQLSGEYKTADDLLGTIIGLTSGSGKNAAQTGRPPAMPLYLRDLFEVRRGYENPIPFKVDILHGSPGELKTRRSVLLAVEMKEGHVIGRFNEQVGAVLKAVQDRLPDGMEIARVSDQPKAVRQRIHQFIQCFVEAVLIVITVALFLMDWRSAMVVAIAIPLTVALTLGGMQLCGVPLHQISIAALIISLGMLVDDPVVASDGINREMAAGLPRRVAAWLGPYKLRRPIFFATVINIVAFLPLALLPEDKGAFILALPVVVTLALIASRIVSMTFIPLVGYYLLRGQKGFEAGGTIRSFPLFALVDRAVLSLLPRYKRLLQWGLKNPWQTVTAAYVLMVLSFALIPFLGAQFFPPAERNQMLIDVELPETASIVQTREAVAEVIGILKKHREITSAAVFTGGTAPRFYYNVTPRDPGNFLAQVLVNTRQAVDVPPLLAKLRTELDQAVSARCLVKQLEQGPPVDAPIQIRISGEDLDSLRELADQAARILRTNLAYKVHDDLGRRMPALQIDIDQERANTLGINNQLVGRLAQAAFTGLKVTELREGDHLVPVVIRLRVEDRNEAEKIRGFYVESIQGELIPVDNFAALKVTPEYASIGHFNQLRTVTVKAYAQVGELSSSALGRARPALQDIVLPPGYKLEIAGEDKELKQSQTEMGLVMAISLSAIAMAMVIQFGSVIKSLVVMITVPLGLIGALAGLGITQSALGFMALLGIVSLAGVIVSHIIVLSDFIEEARAEGMALEDALMQAGLVRLRAVLATVLATVCGLIPLALTGGELWQPLTSVHIFGLLLATVLTLVLLPVWYWIACAKLRIIQ